MQNVAGSIDKMHSDLDTVNTLLEKKQAEKKTNSTKIADLEQKISGTETSSKNYEAALKSFYEYGDEINGNLKATVNNLVKDLGLTNISIDDKSLSLTGYSETEKELFTYVRKLDSTGRFHEIVINNITRSDSDVAAGNNGTMSYTLGVKIEEPK
jgi:Tfp pilus assembly protein PilN